MGEPLAHKNFIKKLLSNPEVKKQYDELEEEFELLREMLQAREAKNKTQQEVADLMKTSKSTVSRLESSVNSSTKHSPTLSTLRRYAHALGYRVKITFIPKKSSA